MAQGRFLNKTISLSEKFALLPNDTTRLIATWCIPHLDKNGVTYGDARKVRALVVPMLDLTTAQVNEAIAAMNDFGLIRLFNVNGEMWMHWPGFSDNQTMSALARERTSFPEPPTEAPAPPPPAEISMRPQEIASDAQTLANDEQVITCNSMQPHVNASNYMLNIKESKLSESKLNEVKEKNAVGVSKTEPATTPPPNSEFVELWIKWAKAQKVAPSFADRINQSVCDLAAWEETLIFGAKWRKIPHSNAGLDWALQNYLQNISKREAELVAPPQQKNEKPIMSMGKKLAG